MALAPGFRAPSPTRGGCFALRLRAAIVAALAIGLAEAARADTKALLLDVWVNGRPIAKIGEFVERDGVLSARRGEWGDLGFRVPDAPGKDAAEINTLIPSSALAGVTARVDPATQRLFLKAPDESLTPVRIQVGGRRDPRAVAESGVGATLNYDMTGTASGGRTVGVGLFDIRGFSALGVVESGALVQVGGGGREGAGGQGSNSVVRLDSTYTVSDPGSLRRYRAGDFIDGSLSWTRPIRMGGVQVTTDFGLRPDLVTFPLPTIRGSAVVPSTLDVLVNGDRTLTRQVAAGPFQIPQLPVVTGAGTVSVTVTNALGRQVLVTLPFYASADLLTPGLQSFSGQIGAIRRNWGVISNDYGRMAGIATYRRGMSSALTLEAGAEAASGVFKGGGGLVLDLGDVAILNAAAAASTGRGRAGTQFTLGLQRNGRVFSAGVSATMASRRFSDVASLDGDRPPGLQINANVGLTLGRLGSVGLVYAAIDRKGSPAIIGVFPPPGATRLVDARVTSPSAEQHTQLLAASYSLQIRPVAISVTAFRDFANRHSSGVQLSLTLPLGNRSSASAGGATGSSGHSGQIQAQQSVTKIGDWGYQAFASVGAGAHEFGQVQHEVPAALLSAGVDHEAGRITVTAEAQGALSSVDGALFASNRIDDGFAVVDTAGLAGVRVSNENRPVGRTDPSGRLLVPNLRSFDANAIAIDPDDIPQDATIDTTQRIVRPRDRSGVVVKFPVKISRSALVILVDGAGVAMPLGATAMLRSSGVIVPVGYGGVAFLEDLELHNDVMVERPDGAQCAVAFDYHPIPGEIPRIGPLPCR